MRKERLNTSLIVSVLTMLAVMIMAGVAFDYYFDLNDDVLMKDILSGAYTGAPESRNIQMLYPISLLISLFYKAFGAVDWYGIFLCGCQYFCFGIVAERVVRAGKDLAHKAAFLVAVLFLMLGVFFPHLIFVQYTVVCGLLSATAAFLIVMAPEDGKKDNIIAIVMIILAYLIRTEMLLLTLPMVGVAVLIRFCMIDSDKRNKEQFKKYATYCAVVVAGLVIGTVASKAAYSSPEWKEFYRFFDNRTELYDFQYIPEYELNSGYYSSIGLSESEQQLLVNYNFGLDDEIDADTLGEIAQYAKLTRTAKIPFAVNFKGSLKEYLFRLRYLGAIRSYQYPMTDYPWNICAVVLYLGAFAVLFKKKKLMSILPVVLFACRSALWMFIIMRGRDPIRITHPLYLMEILILFAVIIKNETEDSKFWVIPFAMLMALCGAMAMPSQIRVITEESVARQEMVDNYGALMDYFGDNKDSFYFMDVYTSVSYASVAGGNVATFSEKMFKNVDNSYANHDLLGGWASKSPLYRKKLEYFGLTSPQSGLLEDRCFLVINKTEDVQWLSDFYSDKGIDVDIEQKDVVADIFAIYSVTERTNNGR